MYPRTDWAEVIHNSGEAYFNDAHRGCPGRCGSDKYGSRFSNSAMTEAYVCSMG